MTKPRKNTEQRIVVVNEDALPISSSAPLQQVSPSPPHDEEQAVLEPPLIVIIPAPPVQNAQEEIMDTFLETPIEEKVSPVKPDSSEPIDEEIVVDKLPEKNEGAEPSSMKQEEVKSQGEQDVAPMVIEQRKETPADTPSVALSQMEVDPPSRAATSLVGKIEEKSEEPMAQPNLSSDPLVTQEASVPQTKEKIDEEKAPVPISEEKVDKEKALEPKPQSTAEGVPAMKEFENVSSTAPCAFKSKAKGPPKKYPHEKVSIEEDFPSKVLPEEEPLLNPLEMFPLFPLEDGPRGPKFITAIHKEKLKFFQESPYKGEHTSLSPRFWTKEQAIYYARILY